MGVRGMNISDGEKLTGMNVANEDAQLLVVTQNGYGKRTAINEYPLQNRGGKGVFTIKMTAKKGALAVMKVVTLGEEVMLITQNGTIVRTSVDGISKLGRQTQGVKIMDVASGDKVVAISNISSEEKQDEIADEAEKMAEAAETKEK